MIREEVIRESVKRCETPAYLFELDSLNQRIDFIKAQFDSKVSICYAMKANPFLAAPLAKKMDKFEVCSMGEFHICEKAEVDARKLVLSGVYKNAQDFESVIEKYGRQPTYTVESFAQYKMLGNIARKKKIEIEALIRLSSGNQFGVDKETLEKMLVDATADSSVRIKGLQFYSGTQKRKAEQIASEIQALDVYCAELEQRYGISFEELEYGPGLYVSYFDSEEEQDDILLGRFADAMRTINFRGKIILEMGRAIAAACGCYLTSIVDVKKTEGANYCIVDGGIHHVNYYGQTMAMRTPFIEQFPKKKKPMEKYNICGSLCTVGDLLARQLPLSDAETGDVLVFQKTGAYSVTEGISLFLSRNLPNVYFYSEQEGLRKVRSALPTERINDVQAVSVL